MPAESATLSVGFFHRRDYSDGDSPLLKLRRSRFILRKNLLKTFVTCVLLMALVMQAVPLIQAAPQETDPRGCLYRWDGAS